MGLATMVNGVLSTETVYARELPMEAFLYGVITLVIFAVLGAVTWSYRDVANRHRAKAEAYSQRHGGAEHGH